MIIKDQILVKRDDTLLSALKKMDKYGNRLLIVLENNTFAGLLSAGDIQRAIIQNIPLNTSINEILRPNIRIARPDDSFNSIKQMMLKYRMEFCPVVAANGCIDKVYYWNDIFGNKNVYPRNQFRLPVVIMAGGLGSRLRPLTNVLPKPLIPVREKTMLEEIFDRFSAHGCNDFYVSVNYKANLIEYYINNLKLNLNINFFKEEYPLGTAGGLSLLRDIITQTFFVTNCDIIIEQDYSEILEYHKECNNEITVVAALKDFSIPYGTIESGDNGQLIAFREKPEFVFKINSGMYILEPHLLNEIPENDYSHITDLIEKLYSNNRKVGVFPVSQGSWKDMGDQATLMKILLNN